MLCLLIGTVYKIKIQNSIQICCSVVGLFAFSYVFSKLMFFFLQHLNESEQKI